MAETKESIHNYDIIKQIGSGSFGVVYLVKSKESKETTHNSKIEHLVMKQISLAKLDARQRLDAQKEILLLSTLTHPNIVSYRHSFENDVQQLHIIMDYCDGGDLYRKITDRKRIGVPFDERQLAQWFVQICFALKYIHERKILHRDLKTQNIFACEGDNMVKVGDFGIARILDHTADLAATCIGTPYYLSPEVCQNRPYGTKTDVWALGCVLYELASFRHPFEGRHLTELLTKIVRGIYEPLPMNYSPRFKQLIGHMLKVNSNERPDINGLFQRDYVYEHAAIFLKRWGRHDELAVLEDLIQQKRNAKQELKNHQSSRPLGVAANTVRRHTPNGSSRQKSTVGARKAYFEKKFRMYMPPAAGARTPRLEKSGVPGPARNEAYVRQRHSLTPVAESQIPSDPIPPTMNFTESGKLLEESAPVGEDQASPSPSGHQRSPRPDATVTMSNVQVHTLQGSASEASAFGSTITKPKKRERKKWNAFRPPQVMIVPPTATTTRISAAKNDQVLKPAMGMKAEISAAEEYKTRSTSVRNITSSIPSIPGSVDDGWPEESQVCEMCGCQYVVGSQKRKQGTKSKKQCQACCLEKKRQPRSAVGDNKSIFEKIECLRAELERSLGIAKFTRVYQNAMGAKRQSIANDRLRGDDKKKLETLLFFEKAYLN